MCGYIHRKLCRECVRNLVSTFTHTLTYTRTLHPKHSLWHLHVFYQEERKRKRSEKKIPLELKMDCAHIPFIIIILYHYITIDIYRNILICMTYIEKRSYILWVHFPNHKRTIIHTKFSHIYISFYVTILPSYIQGAIATQHQQLHVPELRTYQQA